MTRRYVAGLAMLAAVAGSFVIVVQAGQRPASAPPLVPLRLNVDGNFRIAPPYVRDPAFAEKPGVPKGRVIRFAMNSAESKLFPTGPVGRGGAGGGRGAPGQGAPAPAAPAEPPQH